MSPSRLVPIVSPILALTLGCSGNRPGNGPSESESDWAQGPQLEAVLDATSGPDAPLSYVEDAVTDSRGHVYIADLQTKGVIVLNPDLSYERTIGREGEGPGDFKNVAALQVLPGDSLFVFDGSLDRVSIFASGSDKPALVHDLRGEIGHGRVWRFPGSAGYLSWFFPPFMASGSDVGQVRIDILRHLHGDDHSMIDSLFSFPSREFLVERMRNSNGSAVSVTRHPFAPGSFVRILDNSSVVYANARNVEVSIVDMQGGVGRLRLARVTVRAAICLALATGARQVRASVRPAHHLDFRMPAQGAGAGTGRIEQHVIEWRAVPPVELCGVGLHAVEVVVPEPFSDLAQSRETAGCNVDGRYREARMRLEKPEELAARGGAGIEDSLPRCGFFQQGRDGELRGDVLDRNPAVVESGQRGGGPRVREYQRFRQPGRRVFDSRRLELAPKIGRAHV